MTMIRSDRAHAKFLGSRAVDVGILDSGIDPAHIDFTNNGLPGGQSNVDCSKGHVSVPESPVGVPANACSGDSGAHGTHVAGIVAAQLNGTGVVGVAPGVTLVPVQVCDGLVCWWSAAIDGITYAGDAKLDVINMSFYADDPETTSMVTDCDSERQRDGHRHRPRDRLRAKPRSHARGSPRQQRREHRGARIRELQSRAGRVARRDRRHRARPDECHRELLELRLRRR